MLSADPVLVVAFENSYQISVWNYEETGRQDGHKPVIVLDIFLLSSASQEHYEH